MATYYSKRGFDCTQSPTVYLEAIPVGDYNTASLQINGVSREAAGANISGFSIYRSMDGTVWYDTSVGMLSLSPGNIIDNIDVSGAKFVCVGMHTKDAGATKSVADIFLSLYQRATI